MKILKKLIVFLIVSCSGMLLITLCDLIPQKAIQKHIEQSTEKLGESPGFPVLIHGCENTRIDNYADSMLINVIYNVNSNHPVRSMISDDYYRIDGNEAFKDLHSSVFEHKKAQNSYSRYWHGMQIFIRPMLLFFDLSEARFAVGGLILVMNLILCIDLWRKKYRTLMCFYLISTISVDSWMSAFTIEYAGIFLLVPIFCLLVLHEYCRQQEKAQGQASAGCGDSKKEHASTGCDNLKKEQASAGCHELTMDNIMIISGAASCFLDFLTVETLTFTIPVIFLLMLKCMTKNIKGFLTEVKKILIYGIEWIISYAGMYIVKWILVLLADGRETFELAVRSAAFRANGSVAEKYAGAPETRQSITGLNLINGILLKNIGCFLHVTGKTTANEIIARGILVLAVILVLIYLFHRKDINYKAVGLFMIVGCIPCVRYMIMRNHSFRHFFFTYRAEMALTFAICGIFYITTDFLQFRRKNERKRR